MQRKKRRRSAGGKHGSRVRAYPAEFRLKVVRLFLEISRSAIQRWVRLYRQQGIEGREPKPHRVGKTGIPPEVHERTVAVKTDHPEYGPRRIADVLKRFFLFQTSPSTVHRNLSKQGLVNKARRKPVKNLPKPRFFERPVPTSCGKATS